MKNIYLGQENGVHIWVTLEVLQDAYPFGLAGTAMNVQLAQLFGICLTERISANFSVTFQRQ